MTVEITSWPSKKAQRIIIIVCFIIFMLVLFVGYFIFPSTNSQLRAKLEVKNIKEIATNTHQMYSNKTNYQELNNSILIKANAVPNIMIEGQGLINSVGGKVIIENAELEVNNNTKLYKLSYYDLPPLECKYIISQIYEDFIQITVNDIVVKKSNDKKRQSKPHSLIKEACKLESNTIVFYGN